MNSQAKNPYLRASLEAMRRAALAARQLAIQTDTGIVIQIDHKILHIPAEHLRKEIKES